MSMNVKSLTFSEDGSSPFNTLSTSSVASLAYSGYLAKKWNAQDNTVAEYKREKELVLR